ncbi:MAG: thioredoxin [Leptonema illini]|jgi:thioredoxin 1|uniref:Thioredoxin n=2 Tax=Leptonema illini TaxID=183 RepID=H2CCB1_9LEPT|nr:thioredoxin [Leptonema illini]EHQ06368.1 thioredoxin [Leptonema illini DSM 21528]KAB2934686.1 MAG: thioredoxin [Leptonema illini]PKL31239.1 MAG: thioredoxin [Spirochaetae bacterium HGW-Spirochaetae-10]
MAVTAITDDTFTDQTSKGLVLVDFWAEWCGPCRMLSPIVEQLSNEMGTVQFRKINVDENPSVASSLGISAIPTMVLYKDGKPVDRIVGLLPKDHLKKVLEKHL